MELDWYTILAEFNLSQELVNKTKEFLDWYNKSDWSRHCGAEDWYSDKIDDLFAKCSNEDEEEFVRYILHLTRP